MPFVQLVFLLLALSQLTWSREMQDPPCFNNCSNGRGICDIATQVCTCIDGYHGFPLCQFAPNEDECKASTDCPGANDLCQGWVCVLTATPTVCVKNPPVVCDTTNKCLIYNSCDPQTGKCPLAENKTITCNDGNPCTDDSCNPSTGECIRTNRSCSYLDTSCKIGYCDPRAPQDAQCFVQSVICPNPSLCGKVFCVENSSFCGCVYDDCPVGSTLPPTPPPTTCKTAMPTNAPIGPTSPQSSPEGLSTGAIIGIAVGAGVGGLIILVVIILVVWKFVMPGDSERV